MNPAAISIIIPTGSRLPLLQRTMQSLADCVPPTGLRQVIIAENGSRCGAEAAAARFAARLPVTYQFTEKPNKSDALNAALAKCGDDLVVFFDDDIRIHRGAIVAYADAVQKAGQRRFYCGPCRIDYEGQPPPDWLRPYLPPSAKGWDLGPAAVDFDRPDALGFNWAAFAADVRAAGGFDPKRGPGTAARGQESAMQERLLSMGIKGRYLPEALAWHFVPSSRCDESWALKRHEQEGVRTGLNSAGTGEPPGKPFRWRVRQAALHLMLALAGPFFTRRRRFHYRYQRAYFTGVLQGWSQSRSAQTPSPKGEQP